MRAEHVAVVGICAVLTLMHLGKVHWPRFIIAFVIIDLLGYIPGAIAYRRRGGGRISVVYHYLYNITHSYLVAMAAVGVWALTIEGFEWAMLAMPIHLSGDRGLFGNVFKPLALSFEPVAATLEVQSGYGSHAGTVQISAAGDTA
jgi:hypothetical protein